MSADARKFSSRCMWLVSKSIRADIVKHTQHDKARGRACQKFMLYDYI